MRQASNSPLTQHPFSCILWSSVRALPRALGWADGLLLTPFHFHQKVFPGFPGLILDMPYPPRSCFRSRLGEGSVRRLSAITLLFMMLAVFGLPARMLQAADPPAARSAAIGQAVKLHIAGLTAWKEAEITVRSITCLGGAELPRGELSFRVLQKNIPANYHRLLLPLEALQDGRGIRTFWILADVSVRARVLKVTHRLQYGSAISPQDVAEAEMEISDPRVAHLRSMNDAIGKILRRNLSPGDPLTRECLAKPLLVRLGDIVKLRLRAGSISLAASARAEQNGWLGQVIRVRNLDFSRSIRAEVTGPGEVTIE
jgi:flagella basal body P-ring formation protein FlgA